jgi:hypothetical protein
MVETTQVPAPPVQAQKERVFASYSSLLKHRICPQRWYYAHVRRLAKVDPNDVKVEMEFGSWWHMLRAADSLARGRELKSLQWWPDELTSTDDGPRLPCKNLDISVVQVMDAARKWWEKQSPATRNVWADRIGEGLPERLWSLQERWAVQWGAALAQERPLAVELRWERDLPPVMQPGATRTADRVPVDPNVTLIGYVDEIYEDTLRRIVAARDHKLKKRLNQQTTADDMMDSQLQLYAWGAAPRVADWGKKLSATAYDRVRMVKPPTPKVTQMGGLSKSVSDYDLQTYLDWCKTRPTYLGRKADGSQGGVYEASDAEVARLSSPAHVSGWFQRTLTPLNVNLIRTHLRAAVDSALDQSVSYARAEIENAASRNLANDNCKWCDFAGLCRAEMFGGSQGSFDLANFGLIEKERTRR